MNVSPIEAAREAIAHTRRIVFPVRLETWIVLGFLAFLDQCGRTGWNSGANWSLGDGRGRGEEAAREVFAGGVPSAIDAALAWLSAHLVLVVASAIAGFLVVTGVLALVMWINARGTFMYLDAVASGRAEVKRPWREHGPAASTYFAWRLGIVLAAFLVVLTIASLALVSVVAAVRSGPEWWSRWPLVLALAPVVLVLLFALPLLALAGVALRDFVAPLQISAALTCGQAVRVFEGLLVAHPGAFVIYLLLKIVLLVATAVVVLVGGCLTCCLGFLPVVCQTLFQPLFFFERAWPLFLLRQMGHDLPARYRA